MRSKKIRKGAGGRACGKCRRDLFRWLFLIPGMVGVLGFVLLPCADVLLRSFQNSVTGKFTGLSNYIQIFSNQAFLLAVKNTVRFVAVCLPLLIGLGLAVALLLYQFQHSQLFKALFLFPMAMPAVTVVFVWQLLFADSGLINRLAGTRTVFMESSNAFGVLVVTYLWKNLGYTVILWMAGIHMVPKETLEAAAVDGAGACRRFVYCMLPQLRGTLYTITVLSFLNSFKVFREAYLVAGAYPHESIYLLQHLFNNWFARLELDKMAAAAVCMALLLLTVILLLEWLWEKRDT